MNNSNGEDKRTVEDTLIDDYTEHPEGETGKVLLKEDARRTFSNTLGPRERDVLRLRYGLDDGRVKTLEEIGKRLLGDARAHPADRGKALRKLRRAEQERYPP